VVITTYANELIADIHDRMPAILAPEDYTRWLSDEPDPRDLMRPSSLMRMWPISTRVNKPENDDSSISEPINLEKLRVEFASAFGPIRRGRTRTRQARTRPLSLSSGYGAQGCRVSAAPQWRAWFTGRGGFARFLNAEAVGKSQFVLGGSFDVSADSTTECSPAGHSKPQTSKPGTH
jgi:hypothetical protein